MKGFGEKRYQYQHLIR
uniref:4-hydroxybenzoate polyprenyltransferase 4-HB polyprenyltransferase Para-hydroxybenzoatepolyprenyltransferase n=1 Tax=Rhizophora mucronata TaxID=61149 RepID=A0A2P2KRA6_RHIMU